MSGEDLLGLAERIEALQDDVRDVFGEVAQALRDLAKPESTEPIGPLERTPEGAVVAPDTDDEPEDPGAPWPLEQTTTASETHVEVPVTPRDFRQEILDALEQGPRTLLRLEDMFPGCKTVESIVGALVDEGLAHQKPRLPSAKSPLFGYGQAEQPEVRSRETLDNVVLDVLRASGVTLKRGEIAQRANLSPDTVTDVLARLRVEGRVVKFGEASGTSYTVTEPERVSAEPLPTADALAEEEPVAEEPPEPEPEPAPEPERERPEEFGRGDVSRTGEVMNLRSVSKAMEELGEFTRGELAAHLNIKPVVASKWIAQLRARAALDARDDDERGTVFSWEAEDYVPNPDPVLDVEEVEEERPTPLEVTTEAVRDFVVETCKRTGEPVGVGAVVSALGGTLTEVNGHLEKLEAKGILFDVSPFPDVHLYEYEKDKSPGEAAVKDMQRRRQERAATGTGSAPVPGTGKLPLPSQPDARQFVQDLRSAGYTCFPAGSGHWSVEGPGIRRVLISGSPKSGRTTNNERRRLEKMGAKF